LIGSATLIAEVEQEGIVSAWASSDPSATGPNQFWGKTDQPIIAGTTSAETVGKKCGPASLRPTVLNLGDLEIPIQNDLNGPLNTFGIRFWSLLCSKHVATEKPLTLGSVAVTRIGD
jgi:DEAD/DEAH box helicase domain-containing protein